MRKKPINPYLVVLALATALLFGSAHPAAAAQTSQLHKVWSWLSCVATSPIFGNALDCGLEIDPDGLTVRGDCGLEIDPNGGCVPAPTRGLEIDPNGSTAPGDCGLEIDPDGHCRPATNTNRGPEIDPDGSA
jgi:hypothetical protein